MTHLTRVAATLCATAVLCGVAFGEGKDLITNGDFADGTTSWEVNAVDGGEIVVGKTPDGGKHLTLRRTKEGAQVKAQQYSLRLKPQTLYRLSATGSGNVTAKIKLAPASSKDREFQGLYKNWATCSAPFEASTEPRTMTFVFDSGLKTDSAYVSIYLKDPKEIGEFHVRDVSLVEAGPSKPREDEIVILHLGDSITITSYLPFHQRVDRQLQAMLEKANPNLKTRNINLGADGEWIGDLLDSGRYRKCVKENYAKLDVVFIRYGANDTRKYNTKEFKAKLRALCAELKRDYPGVSVILGTGPFALGLNWGNTRQYGPYWQAIREVAAEDGYPLADIYKRFEREKSVETARREKDLHPSAFGVKLTAQEEFAVLQDVLKARERKR